MRKVQAAGHCRQFRLDRAGRDVVPGAVQDGCSACREPRWLSVRRAVARILRRLPGGERRLLRDRFGIGRRWAGQPQGYYEIGRRHGMTQERASQMVNRLLAGQGKALGTAGPEVALRTEASDNARR